MEEKYGADTTIRDEDSEESESSSDDEDDIAVLATEKLDNQILATLNAIKNKDPRVYDGTTSFYDPIEAAAAKAEAEKAEKPMYLRDYHRENLLAGHTGAEEEEDDPQTFVQQQAHLKRTIVKEMHAAAEADGSASDDEDAFMVPKSKPEKPEAAESDDLPDPTTADPNNPDEYLHKFLNSRVWAKDAHGHMPIDSDDSESDADAEQLEHAYNLRFENPDALERAKLVSYGRDAVKDNTVRREEKSRRKKAREEKIKRKEEEKIQRDIEKRRLTKLKTEELMEKLKKIKEAAGLDLVDEEAEADVFHKLLEGEFSDADWEEWMQQRFGDQYYSTADPMVKPDFDDDIDIKDIIPDFSSDDADSDAEPAAPEEAGDVPEEVAEKFKKRKSKRDLIAESREKKQKEKSTRRKLERFVEENVDFDAQLPGGVTGAFRYRETTPEDYGLQPIDILAAQDADLNSYAGLKKYAAFRDADKKARDRKQYAKKKKLKQWRKEVFGDSKGIEMPADWQPEGLIHKSEKVVEAKPESNIIEDDGERKKKRRKKNKSKA